MELETVKSRAVTSRKAEHVRCKCRIGIVACIGAFEIDHLLEIVFINECANQIGCIFVNLARNGAVKVLCVGSLLENEIVGNVQNA